MTPFGPVADYLPHRPPMLLVDHIEACTGDTVVCRSTIHPDGVFVRDGAVHGSALIEYAAQACAVHAGVTMREQSAAREPRGPGILVSCREVTLHVEHVLVGDELVITATRQPSAPPLTTFTATIARGPETIASLSLSVMDNASAVLGGESAAS